jgi:hypothetical protein
MSAWVRLRHIGGASSHAMAGTASEGLEMLDQRLLPAGGTIGVTDTRTRKRLPGS